MKYALVLATATTVFATIHQVKVGDAGLNYDPDTITAATGDVIEFQFGSGHDVVSGDFNNPCQPNGDAAIYSGFPQDGEIFSVTVNSTDPIWFYCSAPHHCQGGMAMVVNPPSNGQSLDQYKQAAESVSSASAPSDVQGGIFGVPSDSSSSSSSAAASSSTSSAASESTSSAAASSSSSASESSSSSAASSSASAASTSGSEASSTASSSGSSASASNAASANLVSQAPLMAGAVFAGSMLLLV